MTAKDIEKQEIWRSFCRAIDTDLRDRQTITGVSGIEHSVEAISVDDKNKRLVVISAEFSPRVAAMIQVDVQATMPDIQVIVARPVAFDLGAISRDIFKDVNDAKFDLASIQRFSERVGRFKAESRKKKYFDKQLIQLFGPAMRAVRNVKLPIVEEIGGILQQASQVDWSQIKGPEEFDSKNPVFYLKNLFNLDNIARDREHGICPIPLYEFTDNDWEMFASGRRTGEIKQRLKALDIYQYFFPAPDQLALGLVDRGITKNSKIVEAVNQSSRIGHPLGDTELVSPKDVPTILSELSSQGYIAEGEVGIEITPEGESKRVSIKFRPREGFVVKLLNRVTLNLGISPSDLFR